MRLVWFAVACVACGRYGFAPTDDGAPKASSDAGAFPGRCAIPARPDVSSPTSRVTTCTEAAVQAALTAGGTVSLGCAAGTVIALTQPLVISSNVVLAANGVTFDGQQMTRVMQVTFGARLTLLDATITRGSSTDQGAGIRADFGSGLVVYDSTFVDNRAPLTGSIGGGAIGALPNNVDIEVYGSTFENNRACNGGAIEVFANATIAATVFRSNQALGGAPDGFGGAINATGNGNLSLCEVTIEGNSTLGTGGGAVYRVAQSATAQDLWERVHLVGNTGSVGGAYLEGMTLTLRQVDIADNTGDFVGGMWVLGGKPFDAENIAVTNNVSVNGVGAGLRVEGSSGTIAFSTFADNRAPCGTCTSGALHGAPNVTLVATVIADNSAGSPPSPCEGGWLDGGGTFQWPSDPTPCTSAITFADPLLAAADGVVGPDGSYRARSPLPGSPLIGSVGACPAIDLRGRARPNPCTAGAIEP